MSSLAYYVWTKKPNDGIYYGWTNQLNLGSPSLQMNIPNVFLYFNILSCFIIISLVQSISKFYPKFAYRIILDLP